MSWQDRVDNHLTLTSPSGQLFLAHWVGGKRSKAKRLGVLEYPLARGAVVQDLDIGPQEYPITLYFDGPDHDLTAERFWRACDERGVWQIVHPVKGHRTLQLVKVTEAVEPVTSGNVTEFDSEWIEPGINLQAASTGQLAANAREQADTVLDIIVTQIDDAVRVDTPSALAQLTAAVNGVLARMQAVKYAIMGVSATISEIRRGVLYLLTAPVMNTAALAGAITSLITTPALIIKDLGVRFDYFDKVLTDAFTTSDSTVSVNEAAVRELTAIASLTGMAVALTGAAFTSRESALSYLDRLQTSYLRGVNGLDSLQERFADSPVDAQYFSQSQSYLELVDLMSMTRDLLLRRAFDLAVAKHITLDRYRSPVEIALTEGVDLDSFITANNLHADEILLLPPGRQVVIYL